MNEDKIVDISALEVAMSRLKDEINAVWAPYLPKSEIKAETSSIDHK